MPRIRINTGVELYYEQGGVAQDETVVFVNGLTMDTSAWAGVVGRLNDSFSTLVYDCRGQGKSEKPEGLYTPMQHTADLMGLIDALDLQKIHLVGLSNGGLVSMILAGELSAQPGRLLSLTTVNSFARVDTMLQTVLHSWREALRAGGSGLRFDVATPWVWGHSFLTKYADDLKSYREKAAQVDSHVVASLIDGLRDFGDARRSLRAYEGPLLAVVGKEDLLTPLRYSHEIVEWARHGVLVTLDNAGHAAPIEQPDALSRVLRGFIERREEFMTPLWKDDDEHPTN